MESSIALHAKYENDKRKYEIAKDKISFWTMQLNSLSEDLQSIAEMFQKIYEETSIDEELPGDLKEKLKNRLDGIRLSVKSANRLNNKLPADLLIPVEFDLFQTVSVPVIKNQQENVTAMGNDEEAQSERNSSTEEPEMNDSDSAAGNTESVLKDSTEEPKQDETESDQANHENECNNTNAVLMNVLEANENLIDQMQNYLEQVEKKFAKFIEKSFAPVMDGLYSGLSYSMELQAEVNMTFTSHSRYVDQWLTVYSHLMDPLKELLIKYFVVLLIPTSEEYFDENLHEPIATLPDENLKDEQIKELVRYGYVYSGELLGMQDFLIRPAQVIVVKN